MTTIQFPRQVLLRMAMAAGFAAILWLALSAFSQQASAHGYVESPASRALLCKQGVNTDCGAIVYEPQSLEAPKGFPNAGPADGKLASAGGAFPKQDEQSSTRWSKVPMTAGVKTFTWKFTANHATSKFHYYITKPNWDPNKPLTRDQFDLNPFCTLDYNGKKPPTTLSHDCDVPARTGYHVIFAVWDVADTVNAFYNAIDVDFGNGPVDNQAPTAPANLAVSNVGTVSATLAWNASTDNVGVTGYKIYVNGNLFGETSGSTLNYNLTGLVSNTNYSVVVKAKDAAGNESAASNTVTFTTETVTNDTEAPTAPTHLHIMGTPTDSSVHIMWGASTDNAGVTGYNIYQNGVLVATINDTEYVVSGLAAETSYTFTVTAFDAAGNESAASNSITAVTAAPAATYDAWSASTVYVGGNKVSHNGQNYEAKWWTLGEIPGKADVWKLIP